MAWSLLVMNDVFTGADWCFVHSWWMMWCLQLWMMCCSQVMNDMVFTGVGCCVVPRCWTAWCSQVMNNMMLTGDEQPDVHRWWMTWCSQRMNYFMFACDTWCCHHRWWWWHDVCRWIMVLTSCSQMMMTWCWQMDNVDMFTGDCDMMLADG